MNQDWRPSCTVDILHRRAQLLHLLRSYFLQQNVMEVEAPILGTATVTDPHIQALKVQEGEQIWYLQTSPEFAMKRLLATHKRSIYYLGKAFRRGEMGVKHNPEFTMLEWYRPDFNDSDLMVEVRELLLSLKPDLEFSSLSYAEVFRDCVGLDPHTATAEELGELAQQKIHCSDLKQDKNAWLDLLFTHLVEPQLQNVTFIFDYPACQAALAKTMPDEKGCLVAKRFEVFWRGMELANGYWELTDPEEQVKRFHSDNHVRQQLGLPQIDYDSKFIAALVKGLPECAGVAMGVDRLLMGLTESQSIGEVLAFPIDRI